MCDSAKVFFAYADKFIVGEMMSKKTEGKKMKALIFWKDGSTSEASAERVNGQWMIGGDKACATTSLGGKVFIIKDGKIFWLKGSRMIFQDNYVG